MSSITITFETEKDKATFVSMVLLDEFKPEQRAEFLKESGYVANTVEKTGDTIFFTTKELNIPVVAVEEETVEEAEVLTPPFAPDVTAPFSPLDRYSTSEPALDNDTTEVANDDSLNEEVDED